MKVILKIGIYLMLLVLLTAENCGDNYSESQLAEQHEMELFEQLQNNFTANELDAESLQALEIRALQKFNELVEYMNMYADSSLNTQFRSQLKQLIQDAFVSEQHLQSFFTQLGIKEDHTKPFLSNINETAFHARIESVTNTSAFQLSSDGNYEIKMSYRISNKGVTTQGKVTSVAKKTPKKFGKNTLEVWELFFTL